MIQIVEGIFRNGKVELLEAPANIQEARVIVTFLPVSMGPEGGTGVHPRRGSGFARQTGGLGSRLERAGHGGV